MILFHFQMHLCTKSAVTASYLTLLTRFYHRFVQYEETSPSISKAAVVVAFIESNLYQSMKQVAASFHLELPSPILNRKMLILEKVASLASGNVKKSQQYMAHSNTSSEKYHQFPSTSETVQTHLQIQQVTKERYFTNEQDKCILKNGHCPQTPHQQQDFVN